MTSSSRRPLEFAAVVIASGMFAWIGIRQIAWFFVSPSNDYLTALGSISALATAAFTAAAAVAAFIYVALTYGLSAQGHRVQQTTLMQQLMREYDDLRDDITIVRTFWMEHGGNSVEAFREAKAEADENSDVLRRIDPARFRISRFFVKIRKLMAAGFLERDIVVAALDRAGIEKVFLPFVDPLDQVIRAVAYGSGDKRDRDFFKDLLKDYDKRERPPIGVNG